MGIGARLLEIMNKKNLNTNELAIMIGVPPTTLYSMIKRDSNRVDIDLIIKIAHALDMSADEFLSGESVEKPNTLAAHFEGENFTEEELKGIEDYVNYVKSKRDR